MPRLDLRPDLDFTYHFPSNFWDKLRVGLGLGVGIVLNYSRINKLCGSRNMSHLAKSLWPSYWTQICFSHCSWNGTNHVESDLFNCDLGHVKMWD